MRQIQEKLRAIDIVEAMSTEIGINGTVAAPTSVPALVPNPGRTIMETCKAIALADHTRQWNVSTMTPEVQRAGRSDASKPNVTTALRRLAKDGILELVSKDKKIGYVYRAKTAKAAS